MVLRNINVEYAEYGIYVCSKCHSIIDNDDIVCSECNTILREEVEFEKLYVKNIEKMEFDYGEITIVELERWINILHKDSFYIEIKNRGIRMAEIYKHGTLIHYPPNVRKEMIKNALKEAKLEHLVDI